MTDTGQISDALKGTKMNKTINDFETALDTWGMVADANDLVWTLDENELPRWACGESWSIRGGQYQPTPPFTNAYEQEDQ